MSDIIYSGVKTDNGDFQTSHDYAIVSANSAVFKATNRNIVR